MQDRRRTISWASLPVVALLLAVASLPGCGGGGGGGGSSGPAALPPRASGLDFTVVPRVNQATTVEFRWSGSNATSYQVEVGSTSGASDLATLETNGAITTLTWQGAPIGIFYARVRGRSGSTLGSPSNELAVASIDARLIIDGLIFGFGPLAVAGDYYVGPVVQDRMNGWQPGINFEVILGDSVPAAQAAAAERTAEQIGPATRGAIGASIRGRQPDPLPLPRPGEVTISRMSGQEIRDECSCQSCLGCAVTYYLGSFIQRSRILVSSETQAPTIAHELGHAIGLGHAISPVGFRPPFTMGVTPDGQFSPNGRLDVLEPASIAMLETIYGAGFTAGSSRRQFEAAGLVLPEGQVTASRKGPLPPREGSVTTEGLETVVRRPVCQEGPTP